MTFSMNDYFMKLLSSSNDCQDEVEGTARDLIPLANKFPNKIFKKITVYPNSFKAVPLTRQPFASPPYLHKVLSIPKKTINMPTVFYRLDFDSYPVMEHLEVLSSGVDTLLLPSELLELCFSKTITAIKAKAPNLKTVQFTISHKFEASLYHMLLYYYYL